MATDGALVVINWAMLVACANNSDIMLWNAALVILAVPLAIIIPTPICIAIAVIVAVSRTVIHLWREKHD